MIVDLERRYIDAHRGQKDFLLHLSEKRTSTEYKKYARSTKWQLSVFSAKHLSRRCDRRRPAGKLYELENVFWSLAYWLLGAVALAPIPIAGERRQNLEEGGLKPRFRHVPAGCRGHGNYGNARKCPYFEVQATTRHKKFIFTALHGRNEAAPRSRVQRLWLRSHLYRLRVQCLMLGAFFLHRAPKSNSMYSSRCHPGLRPLADERAPEFR